MVFACSFIGKTHPAAGQTQVVKRKTGRLAWHAFRRLFKLFENIVNVITSVPHMRQRHHWRVNCNCINDRRQSQHRFKLSIQIETLDAELGISRVLFGDFQVTDNQLQRPGFEINVAQRHHAPKFGGSYFFNLHFENSWPQCPGQSPKQEQATHQYERPATRCGRFSQRASFHQPLIEFARHG